MLKISFLKTAVISVFLLLSVYIFAEPGAKKLEYSPTDLSSETKAVDKVDYNIVKLPNTITTADIGKPQLPARMVYLVFPKDANPDSIHIYSTNSQVLSDSYFIYPVQPSVPIGDSLPFVPPDPSIYESTDLYPGKLVEITGDYYLRGYHIVSLLVYPLQYEPAARKLTLYTSIDFAVRTSAGIDYSIPIYRQSARTAMMFEKMVKRLVDNPEEVTTYSENTESEGQKVGAPLKFTESPSIEGIGIDYVIITGDAFVDSFQVLADWLTREGLPAVVKTTSWISANYYGCDLQEKIRNFIRDAVSNWGTAWVLLGGEWDIVPLRYAWNYYWYGGTFIPSDYYYSCLEGNWNADGDVTFGEGSYDRHDDGTSEYYPPWDRDSVDLSPDVFVGRWPFADESELSTYLYKYFNYIKPDSISYQRKSLFVADETGRQSALDTVATILSNYDFQTSRLTNAAAEARDSVNVGFGIVDLFAHSNPTLLGAFGNNGHMDGLVNDKEFSVMYAIACEPMAWDYDCVAERWLDNSHGGGVCFIGATRADWSASQNYNRTFFEHVFIDTIYYIGQALAESKSDFIGSSSEKDYVPRWIQFAVNLSGEPSMPIWTDTPEELVVSFPDTIKIGPGGVTVTVTDTNGIAIQGAWVCLQKGTEAYSSSTTNAIGEANFYYKPETPGTISVTVTAHNFIAYEGICIVEPTTESYVCYHSCQIDDDNFNESTGNNDSIVNPGETIELIVNLINTGGEEAPGVSAMLRAFPDTIIIDTDTLIDTFVIMLDSIQDFDSIPASNTASCTSPYRFWVKPNRPECFLGIPFILNITTTGDMWSDEFYIDVLSDSLEYAGHKFSTANIDTFILHPLEVMNYKFGAADSVVAILRTGDASITITDSIAEFGEIKGKSTKTSLDSFSFVSEVTDPWQFTLVMRDRFGREWSQELEISTTLPEPPDSIWCPLSGKYFVDINWTYINSLPSNLAGYNIYRSDTRVNPVLVTGSRIFHDDEVSPGTDYYYQIEAVDIFGNKSVLSDTLWIKKNPLYEAGWFPPRPIMGAPVVQSPVVGNLDGEGTLEVVASDGSYIYAWNSNGTSFPGWPREHPSPSVPALADLNNNGNLEVIVSGGKFSIYRSDGTILADTNIASFTPVISDLNGDGDLDIIAAWSDKIHVLDTNLVDLPGWPLYVDSIETNPYERLGTIPAVGDIDNDGLPEIVIVTVCWVADIDTVRVYVLNHDATVDSIWPAKIPIKGNPTLSGISIGDVNNDGNLEIVVTTIGGNPSKVALIGSDASIMQEWQAHTWFPATLGDLNGDGNLEIVVSVPEVGVKAWHYWGEPVADFSSEFNPGFPCIGDVNDDYIADIIVTGTLPGKNLIFGFNSDGSPISGFPILIEPSGCADVLVLADPDLDANIELFTIATNNNMYAWELYGFYKRENMEWPMFAHDPQRTGCYETPERSWSDAYQVFRITGASVYITKNTVWSEDVVVDGDVYVEPGATLTIEPGTVVKFAPGYDATRSGNDAGLSELIVNGELDIKGTETEPVIFTSNASEPKPGDWYGIVINPLENTQETESLLATVKAMNTPDEHNVQPRIIDGKNTERAAARDNTEIKGDREPRDGSKKIMNCIIEYAYNGLTMKRDNFDIQKVDITDCQNTGIYSSANDFEIMQGYFRNNTKGIWVDDGNIDIKKSKIENSEEAGIHIANNVTALLQNDTILGSGKGIWFGDNATGEIKNCAIMNNVTGIYTSDFAEPLVKLSEIVNNASYGVYIDNESNPNLGDNNANKSSRNSIHGNEEFDLYNATSNTVWAQQNYWGTPDPDIIALHIGDFYDDLRLGEVTFEPIWEGPSTKGSGGAQSADSDIPLVFALHQNYPNPFYARTTIKYTVPRKADVSLKIYDISGRSVHTLINEKKEPGYYTVAWDAKNLPAGAYFARFSAGNFTQTQKLILVR